MHCPEQPDSHCPENGSSTSAPTRGARRRHGMMLNVLVALMATLASVALLEVGCRAMAAVRAPVSLQQLEKARRQRSGKPATLGDMITAHDDPVIVFGLIPGLSVTFGGKQVVVNSSGFRDSEFSRDKPPKTIRIAALGDSGTFGWMVDAADSWPKTLEAALNRQGGERRFEVMNFGVPGYNTVFELEVLRKTVLQFSPDVVLVQFDSNDAELPAFLKMRPSPWDLKRSFLVDFIKSRQLRGGKAPSGVAALGLEWFPVHAAGDAEMLPTSPEGEVPRSLLAMAGEQNCQSAIRQIGELCAGRGIPACFLLNPNSVDLYSSTSVARQDPAFDAYAAAAEQSGMRIIDPSLDLMEFQHARHIASSTLWVDPVRMDAHAMPPRHSLIAMAAARTLFEIDAVRAVMPAPAQKSVLDWLRNRAELQWEALKTSRPLPGPVLLVHFGMASEDARFLGPGWGPPEKAADGRSFRRLQGEAKLRLPPVRRIVCETGMNDKRIGQAPGVFSISGKPLPARFAGTPVAGYFFVDVPEEVYTTASGGSPQKEVEVTVCLTRPAGRETDHRAAAYPFFWMSFETLSATAFSH